MPIQAGTYKVRGKMENRSYYKPKYSEQHLVRSINQQMSERVKTEPRFANTRKCAEEFGVATGMSRELFDHLKAYGANITNQTLRNKLTQRLLNDVRHDTAHVFGQRTLNNRLWQNETRAFLNTCSRPGWSSLYPDNISVEMEYEKTSSGVHTIFHVHIPCDEQNNTRLRTEGIKNVSYQIYAMRMYAKQYNPATGKYYPTTGAVMSIFDDGFADHEWNDNYDYDITKNGMYWFGDDPSCIGYFLVVANATKSGNPEENQLQSMSAFKVLPITIKEGSFDPTTYGLDYIEYAGMRYYEDMKAFTFDSEISGTITAHVHIPNGQTLTSVSGKINGTTVPTTIVSNSIVTIGTNASVDGLPVYVVYLELNHVPVRLELAP